MVSLINSRNLEEAIKETKELSKRKYEEAIRCQFCYENPDRDRSLACMNCSMGYGRLADWLEELKELREYKKKMKAQFLDDIENPLEPIKLSSALESEIFKYEYRTEHDPQKISPLDYTIIYALKHCLEEQLKEVE